MKGDSRCNALLRSSTAATIMGKTYHYQVTSSTTDGYVSEPSNDVTIVRKAPSAPPNPENFVVPTPVPLR